MRAIHKVVKGYARMVVANGDAQDLKDEHWLLTTSVSVLNDAVRDVQATKNWENNLHTTHGIDCEENEEIWDCVADLIQREIDLMID